MKRVAYFGHHGSTDLLVAVHRALVAEGAAAADPAFVLFNGYWRRRVLRAFPGAIVTMVPNRLDWRRERRRAGASDEGVDDPDFRRAWKLDKVLRHRPAADVLALWRETSRRFDEFLRRAQPEVVVSELIQSLACFAFYLACRRRGIPFVQMCGSRIRGGMEYYLGTDCRPAFLDPAAEPSGRSMETARNLVAEVTGRDYAGPAYMKIQRKRSYFAWSDVRKTADYLLEQLQGGILECNVKPFWHPFVSKLSGWRRFTGGAYEEYCAGEASVDAAPGKKLLFPLHVTPEASTDLWSPAFADMVETARGLVENLPAGWTLVMKEHPSSLMIQRSKSEIAALKAVPRSVIVAPSVPNERLLERCDALVVVTGTFGLEALMRGRPVITLGDPFYDLSGQTIPCHDLRALPDALRVAGTSRVDEGKVLRFIACYADAVDTGHPVNTRLYPALFTDANAKAIAAGLAKRFLSPSARPAVAS